MRALVTVPTYNEAENISPFVNAVLRTRPDLDVLLIDDNSPDGTGQIADELANVDPRVKVLHRPRKLGLASAYLAGFSFALEHDYEFIVTMDCDFSHRPEHLPELLRCADDKDIVLGSRNVPGGKVVGWSWTRHMISKGGSLYTRLLLKMPIRDCTSGFKCLRVSALRRLDLGGFRSKGYGFNVELNYACIKNGFRYAEIPIVFPDRTRGASKMNLAIVREAALLVLWLRFTKPPPSRVGRTGQYNRDG